MAKAIYLQNGNTINYTNGGSSDIGYLDVIDLTARIVIAADKIAVGATGSVSTEGVFEIPADNTKSFAVGAAVYWDGTKATDTNTETPAGWAVEAATLSSTVKVKIG